MPTGRRFGRRRLAGRALTVAPDLLGAVLRVGERAGRIVEVEAYEGDDDGASHAARGPTARNEVMFGPAGRLYVYRIYGMHWCANVVCGPRDTPGAVLIRAVEPVDGIDLMWPDRPKAGKETDLGSGPGKLCAALGIGGHHDGADLLSTSDPGRGSQSESTPNRDRDSVRLLIGRRPAGIVAGPRIGITKAVRRPWRFAEVGNPHVSKPWPTEPIEQMPASR